MSFSSKLLTTYRRKMSIAWLTSGFILCLAFAVINHKRGFVGGTIVDLVAATVLGVFLLRIRRTTHFKTIAFSITALFVLVVWGAGRFGAAQAYYWPFAVPTVVYCLAGARIGTMFSVFVGLFMALILYWYPVDHLAKWPEVTILSSYTMVVVFVYIYESMRRSYEAEFRRLSLQDSLTCAWNRRKFDDEFAHEAARSIRYERPLSLLVFDVDHFKKINDSSGHRMGDAVLQEIARACRAELRDSDTLARIGGDEFAVLLPETPLIIDAPVNRSTTDQSTNGALVVAERLRRVVENLDFPGGEQPTITIGAATRRHRDRRPTHLIERADAALYGAKELGRNCLCSDEEDASDTPAAKSGPGRASSEIHAAMGS